MYYCEYSFYGFDRISESVSVMGYNIFAFDSKKSRDEYVAKNEFKHGEKVMRPINAKRRFLFGFAWKELQGYNN